MNQSIKVIHFSKICTLFLPTSQFDKTFVFFWMPKVGNCKILGQSFSSETRIYSDFNHKHVFTYQNKEISLYKSWDRF